MATRLPGTDVVVVGLGAAGGVAVLPLADAGLDIVGLEAGGRLTPRDFAPDELRNNMRGWPFSVQKCNQEVPTLRRTRADTAVQGGGHPMMNAVGGTTLHYWAQSWRLNPWDFKVVSATTERYGACTRELLLIRFGQRPSSFCRSAARRPAEEVHDRQPRVSAGGCSEFMRTMRASCTISIKIITVSSVCTIVL